MAWSWKDAALGAAGGLGQASMMEMLKKMYASPEEEAGKEGMVSSALLQEVRRPEVLDSMEAAGGLRATAGDSTGFRAPPWIPWDFVDLLRGLQNLWNSRGSDMESHRDAPPSAAGRAA